MSLNFEALEKLREQFPEPVVSEIWVVDGYQPKDMMGMMIEPAQDKFFGRQASPNIQPIIRQKRYIMGVQHFEPIKQFIREMDNSHGQDESFDRLRGIPIFFMSERELIMRLAEPSEHASGLAFYLRESSLSRRDRQ